MPNILLIGANSAVASELAKRYAKDGSRFYLVARDSKKLQLLVDQLDQSVVGSCILDFNDTQKANHVVTDAKQALGTIDLALIAHGYLGDQLRSESSFDHAQHIIQSNYINAIAFLVPIAQLLKQQSQGKIAVLLSVAGDRGRPRNFTYGSAKGALNIYLQGLRSSLYGTGVEVYCFKLGPVDSPMTIDHEKNFSFSSVSTVVDIVKATLKTKRYNRYVPGYWYWVMLVVRWLPEFLFQRLKFLSER